MEEINKSINIFGKIYLKIKNNNIYIYVKYSNRF